MCKIVYIKIRKHIYHTFICEGTRDQAITWKLLDIVDALNKLEHGNYSTYKYIPAGISHQIYHICRF